MSITELLSIRSDISLNTENNRDYIFSGHQFNFTVNAASPGVGSALSELSSGNKTQEQLIEIVSSKDGWFAIPQFMFVIQSLFQKGIICQSFWSDNRQLATVIPIAPQEQNIKNTFQVDTRYVLSRFALLHNEDARLVLESPLSRVKVLLHCLPALALFMALAKPCLGKELYDRKENMSDEDVNILVSIMINANFIFETDMNGHYWETESSDAAQWEFHDLLFHSRTRLGRHNQGYGGTMRFKERFEPLPALKPPMSDKVVPLGNPNLAAITASDPPFTSVLEQRKSIRVHGKNPISKAQLSEFLYRVARVREVFQTEFDEVSNRPYPGGGAIYELEIYPVINECSGLNPGLYHYRPGNHELCQISRISPALEQVLRLAQLVSVSDSKPQVLLVMTARFSRLSWKYQSIVYALILKHVGVLYQSMYLVATAMGLAPCALGGGDSDLFAQASGLDYLAEGAVGEFMLGSLSDVDGSISVQ
jgi:SagB-type dehydrogenase family enzyme